MARSLRIMRKKRNARVLTRFHPPIAKAYCTDRAFEVCSRAVQIFGGYGYTGEYPVEQLPRDCKITSIHEGAN